jgi:hypothetical protein
MIWLLFKALVGFFLFFVFFSIIFYLRLSGCWRQAFLTFCYSIWVLTPTNNDG